LNLTFSNGEINLYTCSIKFLEGSVDQYYDWTEDVMNESWDPKAAEKKLEKIPNQMICDALLDQDIFSGVGNIIKNEVLYITFIHPESLVGKIPPDLLAEVVNQSSKYSFDFLEWKKKYELRQHWLAYSKKNCQRCNLPIRYKKTGIKKRRSFFCENCQKLYQ
jgi:endonuclease-8